MKVVGIKHGVSSKTNKPFSTVYGTDKFNQYDEENSQVHGVLTKEVYVSNSIVPIDIIGKDIIVNYDLGFGGKAVVRDFTVVGN